MNPSNASWITPRHRAPCAAAAVLVSTLVLSSVLWLFAGAASNDPSANGAAAMAAQRQVTVAGVEKSGRRAQPQAARRGTVVIPSEKDQPVTSSNANPS
jgi:hypothetical protein